MVDSPRFSEGEVELSWSKAVKACAGIVSEFTEVELRSGPEEIHSDEVEGGTKEFGQLYHLIEVRRSRDWLAFGVQS